jgi:transposase InsO family protein
LNITAVPSRSTVYRVLVRHSLVGAIRRKRRRQDYWRWERSAPMQLWQVDVMGSVLIKDPGAPGGVREAKLISGIDDHSRYSVIGTVAPRATARAVCTAFVTATAEYGVPDEVLSDGKQFTARFGTGGEVLFDRICRDNGITHRLTEPALPTTTGKAERFHKTFRREFLDHAQPFDTVVYHGGSVEFDRVVPASGNLAVRGKQFWLGPARAGVSVTFWADCDVIHLSIADARVNTVRSHLSTTDLAALAATGGRPAGPSPRRCCTWRSRGTGDR